MRTFFFKHFSRAVVKYCTESLRILKTGSFLFTKCFVLHLFFFLAAAFRRLRDLDIRPLQATVCCSSRGLPLLVEDSLFTFGPALTRIRWCTSSCWTRHKAKLRLFFYMFDSFFFFLCSDIDLVICGKWPTLPFGDLSEALQHVAKPGSLKVLERAAVSLVRCIEIVLFSLRPYVYQVYKPRLKGT